MVRSKEKWARGKNMKKNPRARTQILKEPLNGNRHGAVLALLRPYGA